MPTATAPKPIGKEKSLQERCEEYLRKSFPVQSKQSLRISNLWENRYRVTIYESMPSEHSVLTYEKLIVSYFVRISLDKKGKIKHTVVEEKKRDDKIIDV